MNWVRTHGTGENRKLHKGGFSRGMESTPQPVRPQEDQLLTRMIARV